MIGLLVVFGEISVATAQPEEAPAHGAAPAIEPPYPRSEPAATYPTEARRLGLEASVALELEIDAEGRVTSVRVLEAAGHGFDEAAEAAAREIVFDPARKEGVPVPSRIHVVIPFRLPPPELEASSPARLAQAPRDEAPALRPPAQPPAASGAPSGAHADTAAPRAAASDPSEAEEIEVTGERPSREVTRRTLSRREVATMPGSMGDAVRALQSLPGVVPTALGSNQIVVRGTAPESSIAMIDGLFVRDVYHLWGLSSVVPSEMLERLDFYPGNYSVRYGRGLGGLIDVAIREPRSDGRYHGLAQVDVIDARAMLEGPVPALPGWSFLGGARRSHLDATAMPLLGWGLSPFYYDFQAFLVNHPTRDSRLKIGIVGTHDRLIFNEEEEIDPLRLSVNWGFTYFYSSYEARLSKRVSWSHTLAVGRVVEQFSVSTASQQLSLNAPAGALAARGELSYRPVRGLGLHLGADVHHAVFKADLRVPEAAASGAAAVDRTGLEPLREVDTTELYSRPAAFAELVATPTRDTRLVGGVRFDRTNDSERIDVSPRFSFRQDLLHVGPPDATRRGARTTTLKGGVGLFTQAPQPEEVLPGYGTPSLHSSRALQGSLGLEQEVAAEVDVSIEGYSYWLDDLVERSTGEDGELEFNNGGSGRTIGLELLIRAEPTRRFYGWLAYTLSRSERRAAPGEPLLPFEGDTPHLLTVLGSYRLGRGWEIGAKFQYASGQPYTPIVGALYSSTSDSYLPVLGPRMSRRFAAYHELDLRAEKRWRLAGTGAVSVYADLINVYGKDRVIGITCSPDLTHCRDEVHPMPFIPNLGVRGEF